MSKIETSVRKINRNYRHGDKGTKEYSTWNGIKDRCTNPNSKKFIDYGGRGIQICERWLDYVNFIADMGRAPSKAHTIERKDNDGGYEPSNCIWATVKQQANNRRSSRHITYKGETMTAKQWCDKLGLNYDRVMKRLYMGWTTEQAFLKDSYQFSGRPN